MSITKNDLKIGQVDFDKTKISRLSDRPNVGSAVGGNTLSPAQMKKKYDESAELIVKHFNALIDALAGFDEYGNRTEGVADLIMTGLGQEYSLADLLEGLTNGEAAQRIRVGLEDYTLKGYLQYLAMQLTDKLEASRIDVQAHHVVSGQEPTVAISLVGEGETARVCLDFGIPEGKQGERGPSGVYVGDGDMPEDASVQIIPDADDFEYYEVVQETGDSKVTVMSQKSVTEQLKQRSNALKGKMSGTVVIITDIAPTYRGMAVKVSGVDDVSAVKVLKTGLNLWDEQWELGTIVSSGKNVTSTNTIRSKNYIPVKAGVKLYLHAPQMMRVFYYDTNKAQYNYVYPNSGETVTPKQDGYIRFAVGGDVGSLAPITEYANNICISVYNEAVNGTYEAYKQEIYTVNADGLPASGAVDGVTAFDPTTTLMTDIEGAVIEVEYNKDINKAFDELKNAILALGGNM